MYNRLVGFCTKTVSHEEAQRIADHRRTLIDLFQRLRVNKREALPDTGLYISGNQKYINGGQG